VFQVLDLFSGIGGFSLGLERTGKFKTVAFCEIEEFPRKVLKKHWPDVPIYKDVRELNAQRLADDGIIPDIITGGFPCQDISVAGRQGGIEAEKSGLWSDLCRLIGDIRPRYAVVENVSNLLTGPSEQRGGWFGKVLGDLAEIGFDAEWEIISAKDVGCPTLRERVWIVAYPDRDDGGRGGCTQPQKWDARMEHGSGGERCTKSDPDPPLADTDNSIRAGINWRQEPLERSPKPGYWTVKSILGRDLLDGLPTWMDEPDIPRVGVGIPDRSKRLKGIGNAIVPQIATLIGQAILDVKIQKHKN
jgi:DNA (cytosine-5)-methyltransferase 1